MSKPGPQPGNARDAAVGLFQESGFLIDESSGGGIAACLYHGGGVAVGVKNQQQEPASGCARIAGQQHKLWPTLLPNKAAEESPEGRTAVQAHHFFPASRGEAKRQGPSPGKPGQPGQQFLGGKQRELIPGTGILSCRND